MRQTCSSDDVSCVQRLTRRPKCSEKTAAAANRVLYILCNTILIRELEFKISARDQNSFTWRWIEINKQNRGIAETSSHMSRMTATSCFRKYFEFISSMPENFFSILLFHSLSHMKRNCILNTARRTQCIYMYLLSTTVVPLSSSSEYVKWPNANGILIDGMTCEHAA